MFNNNSCFSLKDYCELALCLISCFCGYYGYRNVYEEEGEDEEGEEEDIVIEAAPAEGDEHSYQISILRT